jgi:hypothetical protein
VNKAIGSVGTVVLTFFVTLVLNTLLNYYTSDKGSVSVSELMAVGESMVTVVTIENQAAEMINGLVVEIPSQVSIKAVSTKPAMVVEEVPSAVQGSTKLLKLSQVRPRQVSRVFITFPDSSHVGPVRVSNLEATGLSLRQDDRLESPLRLALFSAFFVALLYASVEGGSAYFASKERRELSSKIDELKKESSKASEEWQNTRKGIEKDVDRLRNLLTKQRLLLQSRLYDYSKELTFWRNAVRSLLLQTGGTSSQADLLIESITASLGTLGTKATTEESFESIRLAGRWLADAEKEPVPTDAKTAQ